MKAFISANFQKISLDLNMENMINLALREIRSLFLSPVAHVVTAIFALILAWFFINIVALYVILSLQAIRAPFIAERLNMQDIVVQPFFGNISVILLFIIPMITMRAFAEEKRMGTFELIYTSPINTWSIVIGKFIGISAFVMFLILISGFFMIPLFSYGEPDKGAVLTSYIGLILMALAFVAAGIFASSITENQIISIIVAFGILLLFWVLGWVRGTLEGTLRDVLSYLSFMDHFQNFSRGVVDTRDLVYYLSFTGVLLFLTYSVLESRRWRGAY